MVTAAHETLRAAEADVREPRRGSWRWRGARRCRGFAGATAGRAGRFRRGRHAARLHTELRAPASGIVQVLTARRGELVGPGTPVAIIVLPTSSGASPRRRATPARRRRRLARGALSIGSHDQRSCHQERRGRVRDAARRQRVEARHPPAVKRSASRSRIEAHHHSGHDRVGRAADGSPMTRDVARSAKRRRDPAIVVEHAGSTASSPRWTTSRSPSRLERRSACSARTAPARARSSA